MEVSESQVRGVSEEPSMEAQGSADPIREFLQDLAPIVEPAEERDRIVQLAQRAAAAARRRRAFQALLHTLLPWGRWLATLGVLAIAIGMALVTWSYYVVAPWTRDGRVRVQVASVAPEVSGRITQLHVADNQFVHKGEVLYVVDPVDFEVALRSNKANLEQKAADLLVKQVQSERRQHLSTLATSAEEQQVFAGTAIQAKAALDAAQQQVDQANVNLSRTRVRSPVNGYVTNLLMRAGDFAHQGTANVSIIDSDSYWIDGYFEETKMARVCMGDRVEAKLMGYAQPITGHVATVTRGIGVSNAASGAQGLPNVDAVFTWVRLAQRIPVRIAIDQVPPGVPLVSGMTATVTILEPTDRRPWLDSVMATMAARLFDVLDGPPARPGCIPAVTTERGPTQSLSVEHLEAPASPSQLNPGLAPGMNLSPR